MRRFFIEPVSADTGIVALDREESLHLTRVLRLQVDDGIELIDGTGNLYCGRIVSLGKKVLVGHLKKQAGTGKEAAPLWVCQGDLKGKKMDLVVQKCTELGVGRFVPFSSSRSQGRIDEKRGERRQQRWEMIVKSACKQSGRLTLMDCAAQRPFDELLDNEALSGHGMKVLFWEEEPGRRLGDLDWQQPEKPLCLMLGPEGGFSGHEIAQARERGWQIASLGRQILRAETATIAAVSIAQHLRGIM